MPSPTLFHAVILKSYETGNTSEVLHTLSAEFGRLSVYARGLRDPKNRFRAILQPLSLVELSISKKEHAEMGTLREASLLEDHSSLSGDLERFSLGLLLAEAAAGSCEVAQAAPENFAALLHALHDIDPRSGIPAPLAACRGMVELLNAAGYEPAIDPELLRPWPKSCAKPRCFWLDIASGRIHAEGRQPATEPHWPERVPPQAPHFLVPPAAVRFLYELSAGKSPSLAEPEAHQFLEGLIRLSEYHHEGPLKSAGFWREVAGLS